MSFRRLHPEQPESFAFTPENLAWAKEVIARYPEGRQASAVIPLLTRAQEQNGGWVTEPMIRYIADMLKMRPIRVLEIATFYTQFQLQPVGRKAHIWVCGTTPCRLRGAEELIKVCKRRIAEKAHTLSEDGDFSWEEVECLGACTNAPMIQIGERVYEDLTPERFEEILDEIAAGRWPEPGPQNGRTSSEPLGGPTTLTDDSLFNKGSDAEALIAARKSSAAKHAATAPETPSHAQDETAGAKDAEETERTAAEAAKEAAKEQAEASALAQGEAEEATGSPGAETPKDAALQGAAALADLAQARTPSEEEVEAAKATPPQLYEAPPAQVDDLKLISGVGPKLEKLLNDLGIYTFAQIASWGPGEIRWVDDHLKFKGRIVRDKWVEQAAALAAGGEEEYIRRFGKKPR